MVASARASLRTLYTSCPNRTDLTGLGVEEEEVEAVTSDAVVTTSGTEDVDETGDRRSSKAPCD